MPEQVEHVRKTILIGVPAYKRADNLDRLLAALAPLLETRPHIRVRVVNDGSHDAAYERVVARHRHPWLDYRVLPENLGCGGARRAGFEGASADWLVCIDDDSAPTERWIAWLDALIQAGPDADFIAGDVEPVWTDPPSDWESDLAHVDRSSWLHVTSYGLMTAVTPNMAMRREAYERAGGFAADMRSAEDCDMTQRLIAGGATYRICADLVIGHYAKRRYRDMRARFRSYGLAAPRYVILRQDWRVGSVFARSPRDFLAGMRIHYAELLREARKDGLPGWRCHRRAFVTAMMSVHFQFGWWAGVRRERRRLGAFPAVPDLSGRFADFGR